MMNLVDLSSKKILVTGASSGIGQATAILLSNLGAQVVACGRNEERLEETKRMMDSSKNHILIPFDVTDFENYSSVFAKSISDGIKLSGFVHCAGIQKAIPLRALNLTNIREIMDTNFTSFLLLTQMFAKKKYSDGGNVVGVSSINAHYSQTAMTVYSSSKGAMEAAVRTIALEFAKQGRRINCVLPGSIDTPMIKDIPQETKDEINSHFLLGMAKPDVVANMIAFLLSDACSYTTGRCFYVDGGNLSNSI